MFKKIKKIGISWALFIALFPMENYASWVTFGGYSFNWSWHKGSENLSVDELIEYLSLIPKNNILKELARLILAQDMPKHNNGTKNNGPDYINGSYDIEYKQKGKKIKETINNKDDFVATPTVSYVVNHMFDHGHMGWYPISCPSDPSAVDVQQDPLLKPRGIFNIDNKILNDVLKDMEECFFKSVPEWIYLGNVSAYNDGFKNDMPQGYSIDPKGNLLDTANNIIKELFSQEVEANISDIRYQNQKKNGTFAINATYKGSKIKGLKTKSLG